MKYAAEAFIFFKFHRQPSQASASSFRRTETSASKLPKNGVSEERSEAKIAHNLDGALTHSSICTQARTRKGTYNEDFVGIQAAFQAADVIVQVRALGANLEAGRGDLELFRAGQIVIGSCDPLGNPQAVQELADRGITLFALELIPRITRAQSMDVLSSMATIAGYKAVLKAADQLPKIFPMLMTAAGTVQPAKVVILGAGVAGLQAVATAKRLGAVVFVSDIRPEVKEQVESLSRSH